jgi:hypothetical protein
MTIVIIGEIRWRLKMFSMRVFSRLFLLLLTASLTANAADATGYVPSQCPYTGSPRLHLQKLNGRELRPEIALMIPEETFWETLGDKWYDYPGVDCASAECQGTTHSKVQVLHISRSPFIPFHLQRTTNISGNFVVDLYDGRKISGSFKAKVHPLPKRAICE